MPAGGEILTTLQNSFGAAFIGGLSNIQNLAYGTLSLLVFIDLILAILLNLENGDHLQTLIKKILKYGLFLYFIQNWGQIINWIIDSFSLAGATAGGGSKSIMTDPSAILNKGFNLASPIPLYMKTIYALGWQAVIENLFNLVIFILCWMLIIAAFAIMSVQVFITYLEFYLMSTLTIIFIPWGGSKHTSFLAEKAFGTIISFGVKFMVLIFIICVAQTQVSTWTITVDATTTWDQMLFVVIGCWTITFLCWQAPGLAAGLMTGSPTLTAGTAAGAAMATGSAAVGGARAVAGVARAGASLAGAMVGGAAGKEGALAKAAGALGGAAGHIGGGIKDALNSGFSGSSGGNSSSGGSSGISGSSGGGSSSGGSSGTSGSSGGGSSIGGSSGTRNFSGGGSSGSNSSSCGSWTKDAKSGGMVYNPLSSASNSSGISPVDNATPPTPPNNSSLQSTQAAHAGTDPKQGSPRPNTLNTITSVIEQARMAIPPEASLSGGIHVPINRD